MREFSKKISNVTGELGFYLFWFCILMPFAFFVVYNTLLQSFDNEIMVASLTIVTVIVFMDLCRDRLKQNK